MENRHNWKRQGRKFSKEDFIDHGPLPEERMRRLRQEYTSRGSTTRGSVTGFSASEMGRPSDSGQMDTDDLEYSLSQTQLQSQLPQAIPSSMFAIDSHFDETNSLIMRDNIDQSSQLDYDMNELLAFRNSIGNFQQAYPPQGPQLVGVGAHARSMLRDIPPTLDVEEDGQGENDVEWSNDPEWSENQVVNTMKGS
ncbi:hypothetical protein DRE_00951 [Drechslerella stenobrocha 248]|uniref:Uncharacterized protein n=1 Tax=Drechslerella stenobrocha 248 TaxID=1043628 RepID=W7HXN3_9PEZI|nr:hypothetical protein DRE_00951 [Drechslerella stenobrocha 248]